MLQFRKSYQYFFIDAWHSDTQYASMGPEHDLFMKLTRWVDAYKDMLHYKERVRKGAAQNKKHYQH